jgi:multisubunit Na+/H+ antiporter MnhB subunit
MFKKTMEVLLDAVIVVSLVALVVFLAIKQFAAQGSELQQGYIGANGLNLNNVAYGIFITCIGALVLVRFIPQPRRLTRNLKTLGFSYAKIKVHQHQVLAKRILASAIVLIVVGTVSLFIKGWVSHTSVYDQAKKQCGGSAPVLISDQETLPGFDDILNIYPPTSSQYGDYSHYNPIVSGFDGNLITDTTCTLKQALRKYPNGQVVH